MRNSKEIKEIQKEVVKSYKELFDYRFQILQSIDQKISHYLSVILLTESIVAIYIGILINQYSSDIIVFIVILLLLIAGILLATASWIIIITIKPRKMLLPEPLDHEINKIQLIYKKRKIEFEKVIKMNIKLLDNKAINLEKIGNLILISIILILLSLGFSLFKLFL